MKQLPRAILFDLDDTILSFGNRELLFLEVVEESSPAFLPLRASEVAAELERAYGAFWSDSRRCSPYRFRLLESRVLVVSEVFEALRARAPGLTEEVARSVAHRFHELRDAGEGALFSGAVECLEELRRRGIRLALVTNGPAEPQREKVDRFELARYFDHVQIEGEVGFGKPEERAYRHALEALGAQPHEAWMVGDNLEWEVAAPQRLGIYAVWHDHLGRGLPDDSNVRPDRIVRSISELLAELA